MNRSPDAGADAHEDTFGHSNIQIAGHSSGTPGAGRHPKTVDFRGVAGDAGPPMHIGFPVIFWLRCQVVLGVYGTLQDPFKHRCRGGDNDGAERDEDAQKDPSCAIITIAQHDKKFSHRNESDNG